MNVYPGVRLVLQVCVPMLAALPGHTAIEVAVEHALAEGVRVGLDVFRRVPGRPLPTGGVLLAGAEQETHCLGLHALAAALRSRGSLLLGPALPWTALASAARRVRPRIVVLWAQTPVTGRAYRLARFARDLPAIRVYGPARAGSSRSVHRRPGCPRCPPPSPPAPRRWPAPRVRVPASDPPCGGKSVVVGSVVPVLGDEVGGLLLPLGVVVG
ncbi:hypothetical protein, partial [Micromonospora sp. NPDC023633]|uniref:hypothetical protein n=1 Tax=Micromonospora sp. NPDC023633 TaxID=3154320 RepID=UPI0033D890A4